MSNRHPASAVAEFAVGVVALFSLLLLVAPSPVLGCVGSRLVEEPNPEYDARIVFTGTAVRSDDEFAGPITSSADPIYWTFAVDAVVRGDVGDRVTVSSPRWSSSCGITFELGQRYSVTAWGGDLNRPEVTQGDAQRLEPLPNPPPIEGEFVPPVSLAVLATDPFVLVPFALLVLLGLFALRKRRAVAW